MSNPFLKRFLGVALIASGFLALPVTAQKPAPKERKESKSVIRIVENGEERKVEVVVKEGKVWLNGKPLEEASAEDKELYNEYKVQDATGDDTTERRVTVTAHPKNSALPKERRESRSVIRTMQNGEERVIEIIDKDGQIMLNGKPIEEASAEDKELYSQFKVEDTTTDGLTERRVTVTARPKEGAKTTEENEVEVTIDADGQGRVFVMPEEDEAGNHVYRWKRKSADGKEEEIEEMPRFRTFRWDSSEPFRQFRMAMPKSELFLRESPLGDVMEDVRVNIEELRGSEFAELARMEREARDLSRQIKNAKNSEKAGLERELEAKLNEIFDKKIEARRKKVARLEEELNAQRDQLRTRERAKREMIERRKQELLRGNDPLSW
ncbi:MAG: hypothetical protein JNN12_16350 [Bacteroidetes Order II. Incertae sedis bacterium]|nr:hypothetical protein [Bacteroidetes Order II. bacterium]